MQMSLTVAAVLLMHMQACCSTATAAAELVGTGRQAICKGTLHALHHVQRNVTPLGVPGDSSSPGNPLVCSQQ
jgi:cytochrome c556